MRWISRLSISAFVCAFLIEAQVTPSEHITARMIVTLGHFYGKTPPALTIDDLIVTQNFEPVEITNLIAFRGERAGLELFLLVDNCSDCEAGPKISELRQFIRSQPATTAIGVAYIREGRLKIAQQPTQDRERVIKVLSPPSGGRASNPFGALVELIRTWKQETPRRAVLMITNGVDPAEETAEQNPAAEEAIEVAQRSLVPVFVIYNPSADYLKSDFSTIESGQVQLAHVARETGGEGYFISFGPLPSIAPFLDDVAEHLANEYLVEFRVNAAEPPGELRDIAVKAKNKEIDVLAPDRVWVPGPTGR